jgi:hypothetical protein
MIAPVLTPRRDVSKQAKSNYQKGRENSMEAKMSNFRPCGEVWQTTIALELINLEK